jgi:hypothetical protein
MSSYSFTALLPDSRSEDAGSTRFSDEKQAGHYAKLLIRELKGRSGYRDPGLRLLVRNVGGDLIQDIPF